MGWSVESDVEQRACYQCHLCAELFMQEFKAIFSLLGSSRLMGNFINKEQLQSVCVDLMLTLTLTFSVSLTLAAGTST